MYFSQNLDNIWTTSIKILSKGFRKFTDYTFKLKQPIYFIFNTLYDIITPSKIPYSTGKYVILPNPNRITTDEAPDESQALLFYTRQAELARAQTRYGTTTKAR